MGYLWGQSWLLCLISVVAERSSVLGTSSGIVSMWVRIPAWPVAALVSLSKTLNHNCFLLRMGRKAVGPVCCVMHVKEPRTLIVKEKGLAPVFLDSRIEHPVGWICARYKSSVLLLLLCREMAAIELYTPPGELRWFQERFMSLMSRGNNVQCLDLVARICALYKNHVLCKNPIE